MPKKTQSPNAQKTIWEKKKKKNNSGHPIPSEILAAVKDLTYINAWQAFQKHHSARLHA